MRAHFNKKSDHGFQRHFFGRQKSGAGFTLIELLVTLSIIVLITALTAFSKPAYERTILLSNLAYDVALAVREAQVYGSNVRPSVVGGTNFSIGYGVHFNSNSTAFTVFADINNNHIYDGGDSSVRDYTIKNNNKVLQMCAVLTTGGACNIITPLDVSFKRPDPEACFSAGIPYTDVSTAVCKQTSGYDEARITLQASDGSTRCVRVHFTGRISITATCN